MQQSIKIGTRGSPLALAQANDVKARLLKAHDGLSEEQIEIVVIKTSGDRILDKHLMTAGGKGLFTKEIEEALLDGSIDCAVHSSKDMPTELPEGLCLTVFLPREDPRDVFISEKFSHFLDLPKGAILGTASLRRRAQALHLRPDLKVVTFRGNVQTRLRKLGEGEADATFLALAGLNRMDMQSAATEKLSLEEFLPAPAQGAVTVEIRENDDRMRDMLAPLHCSKTELEVIAERAYLAALDGSCRTPIAAHATVDGDHILMKAQLLSLDGSKIFERNAETDATLEAANALGNKVGLDIKAEAGQAFFEKLNKEVQEAIA
ncbi:hydroxymethylbilane synthase [Kordiimonas laminariae]|uniref:hydroxymethylbilane synthase n=1 Tax=Kordiimonas laminariae TaxID=2917717 RepID=UPI001FF19894|nr:hydroxymethylbilane synthase [Kordiimonas laminariae]MCK0070328.1 hydroxymethylbilane synthase [Kordiimonas laminariae]